MLNISNMPTDWWAWNGSQLIPLGICEGFEEADAKAPMNTYWLFCRDELSDFIQMAKEELDAPTS